MCTTVSITSDLLVNFIHAYIVSCPNLSNSPLNEHIFCKVWILWLYSAVILVFKFVVFFVCFVLIISPLPLQHRLPTATVRVKFCKWHIAFWTFHGQIPTFWNSNIHLISLPPHFASSTWVPPSSSRCSFPLLRTEILNFQLCLVYIHIRNSLCPL